MCIVYLSVSLFRDQGRLGACKLNDNKIIKVCFKHMYLINNTKNTSILLTAYYGVGIGWLAAWGSLIVNRNTNQ